MSVVEEGLRYFGMSFMGIQDDSEKALEIFDKANLYYRWGRESGEKDDFHNAFKYYVQIEDAILEDEKVLEKYENLFGTMAQILQLELKKSVENFKFLTEHKLRMELRDINFPKELDNKMNEFIGMEEEIFNDSDVLKKAFSDYLLEKGADKEARKDILENYEKKLQEVHDGIEAFYLRIKEYVTSLS